MSKAFELSDWLWSVSSYTDIYTNHENNSMTIDILQANLLTHDDYSKDEDNFYLSSITMPTTSNNMFYTIFVDCDRTG